MDPILIVLAVLAVLAVVGGLWYYAGHRSGGQLPPEVTAHTPTSAQDVLPADREPDVGEPSEPAAPTQEPVGTLERPESIPGRMQRLRARLAGSCGFGRSVLAVLSSGDLTESDWE